MTGVFSVCGLPKLVQKTFQKPFRKPCRVGVYLGSFNPIHNGHLQLARQARDQFRLDAVEIVALKKPVHKTADFISDADRLTLNRLAVLRESKLHASSVDMDMEKPALADLTAQYPNDPAKARVKLLLQRTLKILDAIQQQAKAQSGRLIKLDYIVGADGLAGYPQAWKEPEFRSMLKNCRFLIAPRPEAASIEDTIKAMQAANPDIKIRYKILRVTPSELSSTAIRQRLRQQQPIPKTWMSATVSDYLANHNLFAKPFTALPENVQKPA